MNIDGADIALTFISVYGKIFIEIGDVFYI